MYFVTKLEQNAFRDVISEWRIKGLEKEVASVAMVAAVASDVNVTGCKPNM